MEEQIENCTREETILWLIQDNESQSKQIISILEDMCGTLFWPEVDGSEKQLEVTSTKSVLIQTKRNLRKINNIISRIKKELS